MSTQPIADSYRLFPFKIKAKVGDPGDPQYIGGLFLFRKGEWRMGTTNLRVPPAFAYHREEVAIANPTRGGCAWQPQKLSHWPGAVATFAFNVQSLCGPLRSYAQKHNSFPPAPSEGVPLVWRSKASVCSGGKTCEGFNKRYKQPGSIRSVDSLLSAGDRPPQKSFVVSTDTIFKQLGVS